MAITGLYLWCLSWKNYLLSCCVISSIMLNCLVIPITRSSKNI